MRSRGWKEAAVTLAALACAVAAAPRAGAQAPINYPVGMLGRYTADGMLIQKVLPDTPADRAGLRGGDLVLKIDGQLIANQDDFATIINTSGGQVVLAVRKAGTGRVCRVGLDLAGTNTLGPPAPYFLGVLGTFSPDGMRVGSVIPCTPAARVGLDKGDFILRINNLRVTNLADFFTVLYNSGGTAALQVKKANGRLVRLDVNLTTYELGAVGDFTRDGLVVSVVAPATPAAYVGLQKGDVILRIDNQPLRNQKEAERLIDNSGGTVTLLVQRPGQRPTRLQVELMNNQLGAWCEPASEGMRVTAVVPGSPAELLGLGRGDVLVRIDDRRTRSQADLVRALRNARGLITLLVRKGGTGALVKLDVDLAY
jgi:S1-C subfamily serine protease